MPIGVYKRTKEHLAKMREYCPFNKGFTPWSKLHPELMPRGKNHHNWKDESIGAHGYIYIKQPSHPRADVNGYVRRATLVMEKMLERYLTSVEIVHHKGIKYPLDSIENKQDDRRENLQLFANNSEHIKFHSKIRYPKGSMFGANAHLKI